MDAKVIATAAVAAAAVGGLAACSNVVGTATPPAAAPAVTTPAPVYVMPGPAKPVYVMPAPAKTVYVAPAPVHTPDPLTVVTTYFTELSGQQNVAGAWSLLSPGEQNSLGGYSQWATSRSDIADETVTYLSGSGDQVTVALHQVRYDAPTKNTTATFTVDGGVITAVG